MPPSIAIARYLFCAEERFPLRRRSWLLEKRFSIGAFASRPWFFLSRRTAVIVCHWQPAAPGESLIGSFSSSPSCRFDSRLSSCTGSGHFRRPSALGLLLRYAPCGFRFLPKQIRSNGKDCRVNFFRFPPKKQTFGTWEPGPLPRLRHVCPESIREFKTEKQTCI
jgi:hypothetical protein